jgi:2-oxoglutarate dehydrogenase E1 component
MLAYGTLVLEGTPVRLSGQDSGRGTFSHRHSVLHDQETGLQHVPLGTLARGGETQATFEVIDSMLSEVAVLGFEYGYSLGAPHTLTIWEAQFGDFANGAQAVIDTFISAAESKWQRSSGLVLFLPHGYEGQGPEHSSARLERFLQLCAEDNLQVVAPSVPGQLFHALRRQIRRRFRKPLVVMLPKSLLRHPRSVSSLHDLTEKSFLPVIDDTVEPGRVRRLAFCSGKVFHVLDEARERRRVTDLALVRVEELYPFPAEALAGVIGRYPGAAEACWVQEEPENQGAWTFVRPRLEALLKGNRLRYVGRAEAASPATGNHHIHQDEERTIVSTTLGVDEAAAAA